MFIWDQNLDHKLFNSNIFKTQNELDYNVHLKL